MRLGGEEESCQLAGAFLRRRARSASESIHTGTALGPGQWPGSSERCTRWRFVKVVCTRCGAMQRGRVGPTSHHSAAPPVEGDLPWNGHVSTTSRPETSRASPLALPIHLPGELPTRE